MRVGCSRAGFPDGGRDEVGDHPNAIRQFLGKRKGVAPLAERSEHAHYNDVIK